jgi:hypothetical protein
MLINAIDFLCIQRKVKGKGGTRIVGDIMNTLIITADLGHFKAYRVIRDPLGSPSIELIENYDSIKGRGRISERFYDRAGRFVGGGGKGEVAKGYGEPHRLETEIKKKLAGMIAADINALVKKENCKHWYLAACEKIGKEIFKKLERDVKSRLDKIVTADLTNMPKSKILSYFNR